MPSSAHLYPPKTALRAASTLLQTAKVPHIPEVVLALRQEMARPEPDLRAAADIIVKDPAITGDLLKAVNSAAFNLATKVTSVSQAAALMGVKRLTNYVTSVALQRMILALSPRVHGVWQDIMEEVSAMVAIAAVTPDIGIDEAYLFGIMHDVGVLIFASNSGDYISQWALRSTSEPTLLLDYEHTTFGVDHGAVGFMLAANWKLPEYLALAVAHHHAPGCPDALGARVCRLIGLAKAGHFLVAMAHGIEEVPEMIDSRDDTRRMLDIDARDWDDLCAQAQARAWPH